MSKQGENEILFDSFRTITQVKWLKSGLQLRDDHKEEIQCDVKTIESVCFNKARTSQTPLKNSNPPPPDKTQAELKKRARQIKVIVSALLITPTSPQTQNFTGLTVISVGTPAPLPKSSLPRKHGAEQFFKCTCANCKQAGA